MVGNGPKSGLQEKDMVQILMIREFVSTFIGLEVFGPQKPNFWFKFGPSYQPL